jgi:streptogramin lyase
MAAEEVVMGSARSGILALAAVLAVTFVMTAQVADLTTWPFPAPGSLPGDLALDEGRIYVALFGPQTIGRLDPAANTLVQWPVDDSPVGLAFHDSAVFYTLPIAGALGILQPEVNVTNGWTVPSGGSWPQTLVPAPTGPGTVNLWFNERTGGRIGRYAPSSIALPLLLGVDPVPQALMPRSEQIAPLNQVVVPASFPGNPMLVPPIALATTVSVDGFTEWTPAWTAGYVEDLALAPDGQVWFSQGGPQLTVLDPSSDGMMPYGLPAGTAAFPVTASITGDIWFCEITGPSLGRLDPMTGDVTLWMIPGGIQPFDLAIDDLGDIWITDRGANAVYNFRPATNEYVWWPLRPGTAPLYLELDAAGTVWFTEEGGNAISRLSIVPVLGPPPVAEPPDTSRLIILGWRYAQRGNRATATINYLYEGGMGLPIYFGLQAVSGGVVRTEFVCETAAATAMGTGSVEVVLRYVGSGVTETDAFRLYVAQSPTGDGIYWRDFDALITWYP